MGAEGGGWLVIAVITVALVGAYLWLSGGAGQEVVELQPGQEIEVEGRPFQGSENAEVVIVEFSEFQCPYCKLYYNGAYQQIKSEYVETGKVKYYFKHLPLTSMHPMAEKAGEAVECAADQELFWELHDVLFDRQTEGRALGSVDDIKQWASGVEGLDREAFDRCLDSGEKAGLVEADFEEGAGLMGGRVATPSFFINGRLIQGAYPFETFKQIIDAELAG